MLEKILKLTEENEKMKKEFNQYDKKTIEI